MIRALYSAASGMEANQFLTDVIANNVANANTVGFKKDRADFQDLFYQTFREAGSTTLTGGQVPSGLRVGLGVQPVSTQKIFTAGSFQQTENPLDMVIAGDGFFRITMPDGSPAYTRDGSFQLDGNGLVVTSEGNPLDPPINVPPDAQMIDIAVDGTVAVLQPGSNGALTQVGNITLTRFQNPAGLRSLGGNLFSETPASGAPQEGTPADQGFGQLRQGFLEQSNVSIVDELVSLIIAQRAFETNSKAVQVSDELLSITNNLRR